MKRRVVFPELISQRRRVPSQRAAQSKLPITTNDDIADKVTVSTKGTTGVSVRFVLSRMSKLPNEDRFITRRGKHQVGVFRSGGNACHPVASGIKREAGLSEHSHQSKTVHGFPGRTYLWPERVPRRDKVSDMVALFFVRVLSRRVFTALPANHNRSFSGGSIQVFRAFETPYSTKNARNLIRWSRMSRCMMRCGHVT